MNFDQFAATFQNPVEDVRTGEDKAAEQNGDVVLAGTILATTKESCCIEINGVQYELDSGDVKDIRDVASTDDPSKDKAEAGAATDKKAAKTAGASRDKDATKQGPRFVLATVNKNAVLCQHVQVPAALLAAVGTWVTLTPAEEAA